MQALPKGDNFMLISSKGRYTLYVLVDLAKNGQNRYIPLKEIAERQNISKKYMEGILKTLVDRNLLEGVKGKGGGYKLTKELPDYRILFRSTHTPARRSWELGKFARRPCSF